MITQDERVDKIRAALAEAVAAAIAPLAEQLAAALAAEPMAWATWEAAIPAALAPVGTAWLAAGTALTAGDGARPVCATCGAPGRRVGVRSRTVLSWWGPCAVARPYVVGPAGHGGWAPADATWALGSSTLSPALTAWVSRLAVERPFDQIPAVVAPVVGALVDGDTLRRVVEAIGDQAEAAERTAAVRAAAGAEPVVAAAPAGLAIAVDGAMAHTDGAWHEAKVGVCQPLARAADARLTPIPFTYGRSRGLAKPEVEGAHVFGASWTSCVSPPGG